MQKDIIFNLSVEGINQLHELTKKTDAAKASLDEFLASRKEQLKKAGEFVKMSTAQTNALQKRKQDYEILNAELKKHEKALRDEATGVTAAKEAIKKKKEEEKKAAAARKKQLAAEKKEKKRLSDLEKKREKERKAKVAKEKKDARMRHQFLKKEARLREKNAKATEKSAKALALQGIKMAAVARAIRQTAMFMADNVKVFAEFEKGIKNVLTLLSSEDKGLLRESLWQGSMDIMTKFGLAANDVNKAMFNTVSAGVPAAEAVKFLDAASTLAIAGVTDLTSAVTGIVSVMNAYGKSSEEATRIAETLFTTQKFGVTTVEELTKSIGVVLPFAAASGISFEELGAAISVTTRTGLDAAKTVTALRAAISQMQKPATESMALFTKFGIPVGAAEMKLIGFTETMRRLNIAYKENPAFVEKMFGNVRGLTSILAIAGENVDMYNDQLKVMQEDTGDMSSQQEAFNEQMDSAQKAIDKMNSAYSILKTNLGDSDFIMTGISLITDMITVVNAETLGNWTKFSAIINDIVTLGFFSDSVGLGKAMEMEAMNKSYEEGLRIQKEINKIIGTTEGNIVGGIAFDMAQGDDATYQKHKKRAEEGDKRSQKIMDTIKELTKLQEDYNAFIYDEQALGIEEDRVEFTVAELKVLNQMFDIKEELATQADVALSKADREKQEQEERIKRIAATSMAYRVMAQEAESAAATTKKELSGTLIQEEDNIWKNFFRKPKDMGVVTRQDINEVEVKMVEADIDLVEALLAGKVKVPVDIDAYTELLDKLGRGEITQADFDKEYEEMQKAVSIHELGTDEKAKLEDRLSKLQLRLSKLQIDNTKQEVKEKIKLHQKLFDALSQMSSSWVNRAHENYMKSNQEEMDALQQKFDNGIISEARYERERDALEREAFEKTKKRDVALLTISFARELAAIRLAAMANPQSALSAGLFGLTQTATLSAIATAAYVSNLALITSQKMALGGMVEGPGHSQGGVKFALGGRVTELEGGEAVLNRRSTAMFGNTLSAMNVAGGGKSFSSPRLGSATLIDYGAMARAISQNLNVVLPVESLNRTQNRVKTIQNANRY